MGASMGFESTYGLGHFKPECPVCNQRSAYMSSSAWLPFEGFACSKECGLAAKAALTALFETPAYQKVQRRIWRAEQRLADMRAQAIESAPKVQS